MNSSAEPTRSTSAPCSVMSIDLRMLTTSDLRALEAADVQLDVCDPAAEISADAFAILGRLRVVELRFGSAGRSAHLTHGWLAALRLQSTRAHLRSVSTRSRYRPPFLVLLCALPHLEELRLLSCDSTRWDIEADCRLLAATSVRILAYTDGGRCAPHRLLLASPTLQTSLQELTLDVGGATDAYRRLTLIGMRALHSLELRGLVLRHPEELAELIEDLAVAPSLRSLTLIYADPYAVDLLEPLREFAAWVPSLARITLCARQRCGEDLQQLIEDIDRVQWPFAITIK
jgi:hypothetical protein